MPSTTALRGPLLAEMISINVAGAANVALSVDQARYQRIRFTGLLTGNIVVTFPLAAPDDQGKIWSLGNDCTGVFTLTAAAPGQSGIVLPQGFRQDVGFDGADLVLNEAQGLGCNASSIVVTGDTTLNIQQARAGVLLLSGTPAAPFALITPNGTGLYLIVNGTNQTATIRTAAGTGPNLVAGKNALIGINAAGNGYLAVTTTTGS